MCAILQAIWEWLSNIDIQSVFSTIGDLCVLGISFYTLILTVYPKKLKFIRFGYKTTTFDGDSIEITLDNRSLAPVVVNSVEAIIRGNRVVLFSGQCVVEAFKPATIKMEPYSEIMTDDGRLWIDPLEIANSELLVQTTRRTYTIQYEKVTRRAIRQMRKREGKYKRATVCRPGYNGKLIGVDVSHVLLFIDEKRELHTVFIHKSGCMSEMVFGANGIPNELMQNDQLLNQFFEEMFSAHGWWYDLRRIGSGVVEQDVAEEND